MCQINASQLPLSAGGTLGAISMTVRIQFITTILFLYSFSACNDAPQTKENKVHNASNNDWRKEEWYSVKYESLCDDRKGIFVDAKKVEKYGNYHPYDTAQKIINDSVLISFDFISDCCLEYSGEVIIRNDTLFLGYGLASDTLSPCDCYCDYRMNYKIKATDRFWSKIAIIHGRVN